MSAFQGMLTKDSPLREIFSSGMIPLSSPAGYLVELGEPPQTELSQVYFLAVPACTPAQLEAMAQRMAAAGQGTIEEARAGLADPKQKLPVRAFHFDGVSFPLRYMG